MRCARRARERERVSAVHGVSGYFLWFHYLSPVDSQNDVRAATHYGSFNDPSRVRFPFPDPGAWRLEPGEGPRVPLAHFHTHAPRSVVL